MTSIPTTIRGAPCTIRVLRYLPAQQAKIHGRPEDCYPAEPSCIIWQLLDEHGRPAPVLSSRLTPREREQIEDEIDDFMDGLHSRLPISG